MPDWIVAVILGIVEGITEFLPVSSTGHLLIAEHFGWTQTELFNVVIQCGAVMAVLPLFPERLSQFIHRWREPATRDYLAKLILAFFITGVGGLIMKKRGFELDKKDLALVAWALLIGGVLFLVVEALIRKKTFSTQITWTIAVAVGVGQLIAAYFPGSSRSGTTILFCLILGLSRPAATEFSFLVGIPTMLAASGYELFKGLHHRAADAPPEHWSMVLLASVVAAAVSFVAVKWLLRYVQTHTFNAFGWYRVVVAILIFAMLRFPAK
jgi:undecaprenyl-diphosphatase